MILWGRGISLVKLTKPEKKAGPIIDSRPKRSFESSRQTQLLHCVCSPVIDILSSSLTVTPFTGKGQNLDVPSQTKVSGGLLFQMVFNFASVLPWLIYIYYSHYLSVHKETVMELKRYQDSYNCGFSLVLRHFDV